jgi:hypothetical protein
LADFLHSDFNRSRASASVMAFSKRASFSPTGSPRIASRQAGFPRVALPISTIGIIQPRPPPPRHSFPARLLRLFAASPSDRMPYAFCRMRLPHPRPPPRLCRR